MNRRSFLTTCATALTVGAAGCSGRAWERNDPEVSPITSGPAVGIEPVVTGLDEPLAFEDVPGTDYWYVADRTGVVHIVGPDGVLDSPLLDISDALAAIESWEQGLLGLALHPEFASNGRIFVRYSAPLKDEMPEEFSHTFALSEFQVTADRRSIQPDSEQVILEIPQPGAWHQSGAIEFGPGGYLYVGVGDGGAPKESQFGGYRDTGPGHAGDWYDTNAGGNGQDVTSNLLGSILRIDVDADSPERKYGIPDSNPLVGTDGLDEHYAWGFRNPYRISFHGDRLFVGDVGSFSYEEVNVVKKGGNYGWNVQEASSCFNASTRLVNGFLDDLPDGLRSWLSHTPVTGLDDFINTQIPESTPACPTETPTGKPLIDPAISYPHRRAGERVGSAVIGGYVLDESPIAALAGQYVFGDLMAGRAGRLFAADPRGEKPWPIRELDITGTETGGLGAALLAFGKENAGDLYLLTSRFAPGSGTVYRLTAP